MESQTPRTLALSAKRVTETFLALGTALTIYWQPLGKDITLKPSDGAFAVATCLWMLSLVRERQVPVLTRAEIVFIPALLASIVAATLFAYMHYHLGMSRSGIILLARLLMCIAVFLAVRSLLRGDTTFRRWVALAFLSPLALFPALAVPNLSSRMWDPIGRLQGLTVNANTAAVSVLIAFALAYTLAAYEAGLKRRVRAIAYFTIAVGMLTLILWTQSRAYFVAAFASALLGTVLAAQHHGFPRLKLAVAVAFGFVLIVGGIFLLEPRGLATTQLIRISPAYRDLDATPSASKTPSPSSARRWTMRTMQQFVEGGIQKIGGDTRTFAIRYYSNLLSTNYWGLGLNYESKFTVEDPATRTPQGANTILDIPVYGGVGAVLSLAYLALLVGKSTKRTLALPIDEHAAYRVGTVVALVGLWVAACLVGSPLFDYQFWILTAIALG